MILHQNHQELLSGSNVIDFFEVSLISSAFLCTLVSGFIYTYAIIVMPGLSKLSDKEFLNAFKATDQIIQNNQPLFMITWIGSIVSILSLIISSIIINGLYESWLIISTSMIYLLGVQGTTFLVHLPLNNQIQDLAVDKMSIQSLSEYREHLESRWIPFNLLRTVIAICVSISFLLIISLN